MPLPFWAYLIAFLPLAILVGLVLLFARREKKFVLAMTLVFFGLLGGLFLIWLRC